MTAPAKKVAAPTFYTVPAGTRSSQCKGSTCRAVIYWIRVDGRPIPIDCDVAGGEAPSATKPDPRQLDAFSTDMRSWDGRGVRHHTTCPDVDEFRGRGRAD